MVSVAIRDILRDPAAARQNAKTIDLVQAQQLLSYHHQELLGRQSKIMTFLAGLLEKQKDKK